MPPAHPHTQRHLYDMRVCVRSTQTHRKMSAHTRLYRDMFYTHEHVSTQKYTPRQAHGHKSSRVYKHCICANTGIPHLRGHLSFIKSFDEHTLSACYKPGKVPSQAPGEKHSRSQPCPLSPSSRFQVLMRTLAKDTASLSEQCFRTPLTATPIRVVCRARGSGAGLGMDTRDRPP